MVERFLRYSLEHERKITMIIQDEKGIRRIHPRVTRLEGTAVYYVTSGSANEKSLSRQCILSAAYARGDDGDTLKREIAQYPQNEKL